MNDNSLTCEAITKNVIAIKTKHSYNENMTQAVLYEITRRYWKNNCEYPYGNLFLMRCLI